MISNRSASIGRDDAPAVRKRDDGVNFVLSFRIAKLLGEIESCLRHIPVLKLLWPGGYSRDPFPENRVRNRHNRRSVNAILLLHETNESNPETTTFQDVVFM